MAVITSKLLKRYPEIRFGISTGVGNTGHGSLQTNTSAGVGSKAEQVIIDRRRFPENIGVDPCRLAIPEQVHGNGVQGVNGPGSFALCDALLSKAENVFLAVSVADCLPIFLWDPMRRVVGAVHAGWRGTRARILMKTAARMCEDFGTNATDIVAFLGPSARVCCYDVGEDVSKGFHDRYLQRGVGRNPHLDLMSLNKDVLVAAGVSPKNIEISPECTICGPMKLPSLRRDKMSSGRMMGVIGWCKG